MSPVPLFDADRIALVKARMRNNFLLEEACARLGERLSDINRRFTHAVTLDDDHGILQQILQQHDRVETVTRFSRCDAAGGALPLAPASLDLVASAFSLQTIDDVPGHLVQIRRSLRPDGLFLAVFLGGDTLIELRDSLNAAELSLTGGLSPRFLPMIDVRDAGRLLQRAGFALPVVDCDRITCTYKDLTGMLHDLRSMGLTNVLRERPRRFPPRQLFVRAEQEYRSRHGQADGRLPLTFEMIFLMGWAPAEGQQQPLARGSGQVRLGDALQ